MSEKVGANSNKIIERIQLNYEVFFSQYIKL